jgi:DNA processing protein
MADNIFDRVRLIRSPNIGPVTYRQMISHYGSAANALQAMPDIAKRGGNGKFTLANADSVNREIETTFKAGAEYLFYDDADYPALLAELNNGPIALTTKGDRALLHKHMVAIVGARNASAGACRYARQLAYDLGQKDLVVVSGLARGIDTAAHQGSLSSGTIGVIAGGIDIVYPPENAELQNAIASQALLIAEMPAGTEPRARHFPHRNRIIAGLALGTVVIEAAPRSGSLITARLAGDAGREVMAVPGSPLDPRARGCNQLIRDGAILVQDADDIAELLRPLDHRVRSNPQPTLPLAKISSELTDVADSDRKRLTDLMGLTAVPVDELIRQTELPTAVVQSVLLELELAGRLERGAGGKVRLSA